MATRKPTPRKLMAARLLHVIEGLGVGGAEKLLVGTIEMLPEHKHLVITTRNYPRAYDVQLLAHHNCELIRLDLKSKWFWPYGIYKIRGIIKAWKPSLVHAHLLSAALLTKLACPKSVPLFYTLHSLYSIDAFKGSRVALWGERLTAREYHHLIGVTRTALEDYRSLVPNSGRPHVLYNFVDAALFNKGRKTGYQAGSPLKCLSIGNLKPIKNHIYALRAMTNLKDLPITLDIFGEGAERESLQSFVDSNRLENVRLMGVTDSVLDILPKYNTFVTCSLAEGFGLAPIEAMACGVSVLASDIPVYRETMSESALYFGLEQELHLATLLRRIHSGEILLEEHQEHGLMRARSIASADVYRERLLRLYAEATDPLCATTVET